MWPLVVLYADRLFPETVNSAQKLRHSVQFQVIASFKDADTEMVLHRVRQGWRMSNSKRYVIDRSRSRAVAYFFNTWN